VSNPIPQTVTVDEALKRGERLMRYPTIFIVIAFVVLSLVITTVYNLLPFFIPVMVLAGIFSACLYWSNASIWWRLWAFASVRNVHELQARAIKKGLLDAKPNFFTRLEFWTLAQKQQWEALQYKFNEPDLFIDDDTVPAETVIRYSKTTALLYMGAGLLILCFGVWIGFKQNRWITALVAFIVGIAFLTLGISLLKNRNPQIVISADGLTVPPRPFNTWAQISNEEVIAPSRKTATRYLIYQHGATSERIVLLGLDVTPNRLEHLLRIYRGRSKKK
jgi:hypothetical protein